MSKKLGIDFHLRKIQNIASAGYGMGLNIRFTVPTISLRTYPAEWNEIYNNKGYSLADPLISWGYTQTGARRWSELDEPDPLKVLDHGRLYGLNYGVVVSHGGIDSRSIAGFAKPDKEFTESEIEICKEVVARLHEETVPPENLTEAQIEALQLIANGGRHAQVAADLGISESALKARLKSARERLLARTTTEAIQRASEYNLM